MRKWIAIGAVVGGLIGVPAGVVPSFYMAWMIMDRFPSLDGTWLWGGCWLGCVALCAGFGALLGYDIWRPID